MRNEQPIVPAERASGRFKRRGDTCSEFKDKCGYPGRYMCARGRHSGHALGYEMEPCNNSKAASENVKIAFGRLYEAEELNGGQVGEGTVFHA